MRERSMLLWAGLVVLVLIGLWIWTKPLRGPESYLDYMPTAIEPCPSYYNCGATTREQIAMENRLYADLRESEKYALPATLTPDQISVVASDAEPTSCMIKRAALAKEGPKPEGMHNTWSAIDEGFEAVRRPTSAVSPASVMLGQQQPIVV